MCRIDSRTIDGVEIFDIGQRQYIELSKWNPTTGGIGGNSGVYRHAKGLWVIVSVSTCFGGRAFGNRITVEGVYKTRAEALDMCGYDIEHFSYREKQLLGTRRQRYLPAHVRDFEIWHIVDDAQLWDEWERDATKARECIGDCTICEHGLLPDWVEPEDYRHGDIPFECALEQREQSEQHEQPKKSETDVYCIRSYHVYDGDRCVLDWDGALPPLLYSIRYLRSDGETTDSVKYYGRAYSFYDELEMALGLHRCTLENVESFNGWEIGISVKDDYGEDTFCDDVIPVAVFYVRLPYVRPED